MFVIYLISVYALEDVFSLYILNYLLAKDIWFKEVQNYFEYNAFYQKILL